MKKQKYTDITGIILSGGKSYRMGEDKSFLKIEGKTVIERVSEMMSELFDNVLIITNNPDKYQVKGVTYLRDIFEGRGPLGGIHSGLVHSTTDKNFIISCDIPLMTKQTIEFILDYPTGKEIVITKADGFVQQLCGIYNKSLIPVIEETINSYIEIENRSGEQKKRKCSVFHLVEKVDSLIIDIEKEFPGYRSGTFLNMNKPEEYAEVLKYLSLM